MGNKKKTKWRKVPSAELSQITVKRSIADKTRTATDKYFSDEKLISNEQPTDNDKNFYNDLEDFPSPEQTTNEGVERNPDINQDNCTESEEISGIYVNGLWIPVSQKRPSSLDSITAASQHAILKTVPFDYSRPTPFGPSTCSRYQSAPIPDVPLCPNYFIPSSDHYLYYFLRGRSNSHFSHSRNYKFEHPINEECETDFPSSSNSCYFNCYIDRDVSKNVSGSGDEITGRINSERVIRESVTDCATARNLQDCPVEEQAPSPYQYPGYAFGQPLYSVPLLSFVPSENIRLHSAAPWSIGPIQRRRRRRRKGYAEYAVIPPKKDSSEPEVPVKRNIEKDLDNQHIENGNPGENYSSVFPSVIEDNEYNQNGLTLQSQIETLLNESEGAVYNYASVLGDQLFSTIKTELKNILNSQSSIDTIKKPQNTDDLAVITGEELHGICKSILYTIISKIDSIESFGNSNSILHMDTNSAKELTQKVNNITNTNASTDEENETNLLNDSKDLYVTNFLPIEKLNDCRNNGNLNNFYDLEIGNTINMTQQTQDQCAFDEMVSSSDTDEGCNVYKKIDSNESFERSFVPITHQPVSISNTKFHKPLNEILSKVHNEESSNDEISDFINKCNDDVSNHKDSTMNETNHHNFEIEHYLDEKYINHDGRAATLGNKGNRKIQDVNESTSPQQFVVKKVESLKDGSPNFHQQPSSFPVVSTEALLRETELELSKLQHLTSSSTLHANQAIYKLAYDENVTDQSENEDIDNMPQVYDEDIDNTPQVYNEDIDNMPQVNNEDSHTCSETCRPLQNDIIHSEILVHEADSGSEAGSEDVELLPHRYQSESVQDCNKHIYVNNLSLAVEMLRTHENLPYDDEFKRIVDEDNRVSDDSKNTSFQVANLRESFGMVNPAFVEEISINSATKYHSIQENVPLHCLNSSHSSSNNRENKYNDSRTSISDSGVQSGDSGDEAEEAKEGLCLPTVSENKQQGWQNDQTASYRRFGQQTRQQFSVYTPRAGIMNPCFCCIVM